MLVCERCVSFMHFCLLFYCGLAGDVNRIIRPSNRIQIRNLPATVNKEEIDLLVGTCGTVKKSQLGTHMSFMLKFYYHV